MVKSGVPGPNTTQARQTATPEISYDDCVVDHEFSPQERRAVYRVISERRDMRRFVPGSKVPDEVLARLLQAAHAAPNVGSDAAVAIHPHHR